ncbi:MAG: HRDC domain-containing protein [Acidimicrobiales bacterium]
MSGNAAPLIVTTTDELDDVVASLLDHERYAVDTEFHRERTYYPKVALVQVIWPGGEPVLIDPLAVSLKPLAAVFDGPGVAVMHAAQQDLEVTDLSTGTIPSRLFDTQIAAGFVGMASPSLSALHERFLGKRLPKGDRLTDWLARPLTDGQISYAAADVADLLEVHDLLCDELDTAGRLEWALQECENFRLRGRPSRDPLDAWLKIKDVRHLRGKNLAVAQAVAEWRERRAAEIDQPVRFVLPDLAVVALAQKKPTDASKLRDLRGLDDRHLKGKVKEMLIEVIAEGKEREPRPLQLADKASTLRDLRPAVTLVSAWVSQLSKELSLDPALLASRNDIEAFVRGDPNARLNSGWRQQLAGKPIERLMNGDAALAFDGSNGLVLEERSRLPVK